MQHRLPYALTLRPCVALSPRLSQAGKYLEVLALRGDLPEGVCELLICGVRLRLFAEFNGKESLLAGTGEMAFGAVTGAC